MQQYLPIARGHVDCKRCGFARRVTRIGRLSFVTHHSGVPEIVAVAPMEVR